MGTTISLINYDEVTQAVHPFISNRSLEGLSKLEQNEIEPLVSNIITPSPLELNIFPVRNIIGMVILDRGR